MLRTTKSRCKRTICREPTNGNRIRDRRQNGSQVTEVQGVEMGMPGTQPLNLVVDSGIVQNIGQSVLNEDLREWIKSIIMQTQTTTLNSGAKVTENLLSRMRELEITVNSEPCEEVEEVTHPFTVEVMTIPIPDKFKLPTMPLYDGMTDPDDHQWRFDTYCNLYRVSGEIACRAFDYTLSDAVRSWYSKLKPSSIGS